MRDVSIPASARKSWAWGLVRAGWVGWLTSVSVVGLGCRYHLREFGPHDVTSARGRTEEGRGMELIGRAAELDELVSRCDSHRLVTVVGPGGVGKTRLAHAAAERLAAQFPNGTSVVDMAAVTDPRRVALELAAQLGFATVDAMLSSPVDLPVLVVVDSCEHVLDAVAEAVTELLASCDAPTVLATSR